MERKTREQKFKEDRKGFVEGAVFQGLGRRIEGWAGTVRDGLEVGVQQEGPKRIHISR